MGTVDRPPRRLPDVWRRESSPNEHPYAEFAAALADALALRVQTQRELEQQRVGRRAAVEEATFVKASLQLREKHIVNLREQLERKNDELKTGRHELDALRQRIGANDDAMVQFDAQKEALASQLAAQVERTAGLEAVCGERDGQIAELNQQFASQVERLAGLEAACAERGDQVALLHDRLSQKQALLEELRQQVAALEEERQRRSALEVELADSQAARQELDSHLQAARDEAAQSQAWLAAALEELRARGARVEALQAHLDDLSRGMAWRLARQLRSLRLVVAPDNTRRHRALREIFEGLRSVKHAARTLDQAWRTLGLPTRMTWYAYAFDRFKRQRLSRYPADLTSIRCPAEGGLVSVVLPVHNGEKYIREAIDSVLAQTYDNYELIIVDDGSTDGTPAIADAYAAEHPQIRVIHQPNAKLPRALSNGFCEARGEFLTWTSDDNRFKPDFLAKMVACLRRHPRWELAYADQDIIGADGAMLHGSPQYRDYQRPPGSAHVHMPKDPSELNVWPNNYVGAAFLYRMRVPYLIGEYSPRRFGLEDYDYWMRANALLTLRHADFRQPVNDYRFHGQSLTSRDEELGITRKRAQMMVFEDFRRSFYLAPATWCVEVDGFSPSSTTLADELKQHLQAAGHPTRSLGDYIHARCPRLWIPMTYVRIVGGATAETRPPTELPQTVLKVLVVTGDQPLPTVVDDGWDFCIAAARDQTPVALPRRWQGWLAIPDSAALFSAIDIRCKAAHLDRLEAEIAEPRPATRELSVIICAYKRVDSLERAIASVACQRVDRDRYEAVIVNNAPEDTAVPALVERMRQELFDGDPDRLRLIDCPLLGLSHARNAGISEARGDILCFLDDDSIAHDNWMAAMLAAFGNDPQAGIIGGKILLKEPTPRPKWLRPDWWSYWSHFDPHYGSYRQVTHWWKFPWGANWAARRQALLDIGGFRTRYGRQGNDFGGGEEVVAARLIQSLGYAIGVEPSSVVTHDVEKTRFTLRHVRKTIRAGIDVNYQSQADLHLPMELSFTRSLGRACRNLNRVTAFRMPPGERTRGFAYARAYGGLPLRQMGDLWRRLHKPISLR